jgi:hypothetical protein
MISIGGSDWFGIGQTASEAYKGTEHCGSRPNCLWTDECKRKTQVYEDCVKSSNKMVYEATMANIELQKQMANKSGSGKLPKYVLPIAIGIGVLGVILIIRKNRG